MSEASHVLRDAFDKPLTFAYWCLPTALSSPTQLYMKGRGRMSRCLTLKLAKYFHIPPAILSELEISELCIPCPVIQLSLISWWARDTYTAHGVLSMPKQVTPAEWPLAWEPPFYDNRFLPLS